MKSTKGLWRYRYMGNASGYDKYIVVNERTQICNVSLKENPKEALANAQLLASALKLYQALVMAYPYTLPDDKIRPIVQETIAEAEGRLAP